MELMRADANLIASFFQQQLETAIADSCVKFDLHKLHPELIKNVAYEIAKSLNEPGMIEGLIKGYAVKKEKMEDAYVINSN